MKVIGKGLAFLAVALVAALPAASMARAAEPTVLYSEEFDTMPAGWVPVEGDWGIENGQLVNYDTYSTLTNIYFPIEQKGKVLIYEWEVSMYDAVSSWAPLAGVHFLADSGEDGNHGNSYFLFQASTVLKLYKSENNKLVAQWDMREYAAVVGETYRFKVIFDTTTGKMQVYLNDELVKEWVDPNPIPSGSFVAFRTNNTKAGFSYLRISVQE
ncbi:MAG TPA: hypothetical protein GXX55_05230 [Firmicutes bacterium]|nr:hypothetical protein [Bacillota bacterium]